MSDLFVYRLNRVRNEFDASREALAFVHGNWQRHNIYNAIEGVGPVSFRDAGANIESVYFIWLFGVFEGILKEHLARSHPGIEVDERASVAFLIDRVSVLQDPHIGEG